MNLDLFFLAKVNQLVLLKEGVRLNLKTCWNNLALIADLCNLLRVKIRQANCLDKPEYVERENQ